MTPKNRRQFLRLSAAAVALPVLATRAHAAEHIVTIKSFAFDPAELTIAVGDTVTFTNEDGAPHTATADDGSFDTGRLNRGQSAALTFGSEGSFSYFCSFHPNMKATITVA